MGTEQQHCLINQIIKVQGVAFFQQLLIKLIYLCQTFAFDIKRIYGLCVVFPADHFFFLFADLRNGCTDGKALIDGAHIQAFKYFLHDFFLIVCVINGKLTIIIQIADFPAQDTHAGRMECADPDIFCTLSNQFIHTFPHFFGCFVGESNCKNIPGFYACFQQMGNTDCQCTCLTAASTCQHQNGAFCLHNRFLLHIVQLFKSNHIFTPVLSFWQRKGSGHLRKCQLPS